MVLQFNLLSDTCKIQVFMKIVLNKVYIFIIKIIIIITIIITITIIIIIIIIIIITNLNSSYLKASASFQHKGSTCLMFYSNVNFVLLCFSF